MHRTRRAFPLALYQSMRRRHRRWPKLPTLTDTATAMAAFASYLQERRRWEGMEYKESREERRGGERKGRRSGGDPNRQWPPSFPTVGVASRDKRRHSPLLFSPLPLQLPDIREREEKEGKGKSLPCHRKGLRCICYQTNWRGGANLY